MTENTTTATATATTTAPAIVGWAILEMHHSQLRTMVRGMATTEADAWRDAFGPNGRAPKGSCARAEALDSKSWDYWIRFYLA